MKICRDPEGYFVLDNNNCKVNLYYKGKVVFKLPTIFHVGLSFWHGNEKGNIINTPMEILVDDITSFKALRYSIFEYCIKEGEEK